MLFFDFRRLNTCHLEAITVEWDVSAYFVLTLLVTDESKKSYNRL